jgi:CheY-like chemotaxis protein
MSSNPILVIEDDKDIRDQLVEILSLEGYSVVAASNGKTGLETLLSMACDPCLVLLDLMMPVMDGAAFLATLRRSHPEKCENIPFVVFSAGGALKDACVRETVKKPVDLDSLLRIVAKYCG